MKVLSITPDIDSGGAAKSLFLLARQVVAEGHEMHIISIAKPSRTKRKVEELAAMGVTVDYFDIPYFPLKLYVCPIPFVRNAKRTVRSLPVYRQLAARVRELGPDIIHYNSYTTLLIAQWLKGYPAVLHAREVMVEPTRSMPLVRHMVRRRIDEIVAIAPEEGEQAERVFGIPVTTVFNWPEKPQQLLPMPEDGPLVYAVFSHVTPVKGHLECVKACALVADELRQANVRIRLFGGRVPIHEGYYQSCVRFIHEHGLDDIVSFPGFVDNPEEEMRRVHLLIRPDTTGHSWGRDIIECMSLGRPVLAMGARDVMVKNGLTGTLVPIGDVAALAKGMVELADLKTLQKLGRNAYRFATEHFDRVDNPQRIIRRMESLVQRRAQGRGKG